MVSIRKKSKIVLIGVPNVGKTSLFNALTGSQNLVGNWDGVTVDLATGSFDYLDTTLTIIDLPGCYSLICSEYMAADEQLVCRYLHDLKQENQVIYINVISLDNLSRDLYLSLQLLEQHYKLLIVINISDNKDHGIALKLKHLLQCQVICCNANNGFGIENLKKAILTQDENIINTPIYYNYIPQGIIQEFNTYPVTNGLLIRYLEGDILAKEVLKRQNVNVSLVNNCVAINQWDVFFARQRHEFIKKHFVKSNKKNNLLDQIMLHKYFGLPIFGIIIYLMFLLIINIINYSQYYCDLLINNNIIQPISNGLVNLNFPKWLLAIFNDGIAVGLITIINFIPALLVMHMCLFILENSGYIARIMVLIDKLMGFLGLSGKSLVPMIIGFSCNVPAIISARTIDQKRDRIITILMTPFMSCNARLAVYSIFATAFFNSNSVNIIFYLYIIGILSAIVTGLLLQTILPGSRSNLIINLPEYKLPSLLIIIKKSINRVKRFLTDASVSVIGACILISGLKFFNLLNYNLFKYIAIIFKPMGITENNWQALASLFSGIIAKEAIIGSLNSFYHINGTEIYGTICSKFGSQEAAFAYLLFILLCFPCVSVITSIAKELNTKWAIFSAIWSTSMAYVVSVFYYQIATFNQHAEYSVKLLSIMMVLILSVFIIIKILFKFNNNQSKFNAEIPIVLEH